MKSPKILTCMHLPASGSTPGRWGPQDSTGTTPPPLPSIAATESATGFFRAFPLLQRVSHFCNTISTSSTLPRAAVAGVSQIARRLRWHRSTDPSGSAGHPSPLSPSVQGSNGTVPTTPHASVRHSRWSRTAPRAYRSWVQPAGGGSAISLSRCGWVEKSAGSSQRTDEYASVRMAMLAIDRQLCNQIASYMIATQGTLDLL